MGEETSIKQLIGNIAKDAVGSIAIEEGCVKQVSPLKVSLTNDAKMILTSLDVIVPKEMSNITAGDKVYLLVFGEGKRYYVLGTVA